VEDAVVEFTHILCPIDLSEASVRPLTYAAALARWYDARLTVLHVVPTFDPITVRPVTVDGTVEVVQPLPREAVLEGLQQVVESAGAGSQDVNLAAEAGDASQAIIDQALTLRADLLVMGTHGRSGFTRFMVGSVAEKVLGHAPCPVLMVPPHVTEVLPTEVRFGNILCPMDFSSSAEQAFGFALDLARQADGTVTLLHVIEWLAEEEPRPHARFDIPEYRGHLTTTAHDRMVALAAGESRTWSKIQDKVVFGRAHRQILSVADEISADLIAMGAQGLGGFGLALFGSTMQQVVRAAHCPVLVIRSAETQRPLNPS